jgi:hypothetical protein
MFYDRGEGEISGLVEKSMREVYGNIKPNDIVLIGAFQKYKNQIREDAEICKQVLSGPARVPGETQAEGSEPARVLTFPPLPS